MKHLTAIFLMILCLITFSSCAEDQPALFPIRESGLWGYMNRAGEVVIKPQWDHAEPFDGEIALVGKSMPQDTVYGLIRRDGSVAVPVQYAGFEDCGFFYIIADQEDLFEATVGWYDKASGFFQEPIYDELDDTPTDSGLILASWTQLDGEISKTHCTYLCRDTGEEAFSFDYRGEPYTSGTFQEGYAYWLIENEMGFDAFLLDTDGNRVVFPDGIRPSGDVCEGVLRIADENDCCGLGRPDGSTIVTPQYDYVEDAREGRTFIHMDERLGIMDIAGNLLQQPSYDCDAGWDYFGGGEEQFFYNGYALVILFDKQNVRSYVFLNRAGDVIFSMPQNPDSDTVIAPCVWPMSNGLVWYRVNDSSGTSYGLIRLSETGGEYLTGAIYEDIPSPKEGTLAFSEGLCPVKTDGLWGYIDENAVWIITPQYDSADNFQDGLALVEKDGKLGYIDNDEQVIWQEEVWNETVPVFINEEETALQASFRGGPVCGGYSMIPFAQVLEQLGYSLTWTSDTTATLTIGEDEFFLDTSAGVLYPADKDERWNCIEPAPGDVLQTPVIEGAGRNFLVNDSLCRSTFWLLNLGYHVVTDNEDRCVRIYLRIEN